MWRLVIFKRWVIVGLVVTMFFVPTGAVLAQGGMITHVIAPGENLYRIGLRYSELEDAELQHFDCAEKH